MSELVCPVCGEALDMGEFHDYAEELHVPALTLMRRYASVGCTALGEQHAEAAHGNDPLAPEDQALIKAVYETLGDDFDAIACELEDLGLA